MREIFVIKIAGDKFLQRKIEHFLKSTIYGDYRLETSLRNADMFDSYEDALEVVNSGKLDKFSFCSIEKHFTPKEKECIDCNGRGGYWTQGNKEDCIRAGCVVLKHLDHSPDTTLIECPYCKR